MIQEAIYDRQNMVGDLKIPQIASVVGCGGTGFWTAALLAMSGVEELVLVDNDIVEVSNLNRLPLKDTYVGMKKIIATRDFINSIRKQVRVEEHDMRIAKPEDCSVLRGIVFCCTDNLKNQQLICAYCKKNDIPYQRIGYDGTVLNVSKAFPLTFEEVTDEGGYTVTPSWVIPAAVAAGLGVASKLYKELCLMDDIGKLHIQDCSYINEKILDEAREEGEENILDNINDHIPDGYGCCDDCSHCSDCERGDCENCEERYSEDAIEEIKTEAKDEGFRNAIEQIESGDITDSNLQTALGNWKKDGNRRRT